MREPRENYLEDFADSSMTVIYSTLSRNSSGEGEGGTCFPVPPAPVSSIIFIFIYFPPSL